MKILYINKTVSVILLNLLMLPTLASADEACIVEGGLAWDNWTKTDAGGSGTLPAGEVNQDMLRCKACHGWDQLGMDGGYVRRNRSATRPNAGAGDGDSRSRNIDVGKYGRHAPITAEMILHAGTGRSLADGSGSWTKLTTPQTASNTAAYQQGYTLGNQHPDFSGLLTDKQVACLVEFLNSKDVRMEKYFKEILPTANPVSYQLIDSADPVAGKAYYDAKCTECHSTPTDDQSKTIAKKPEGGFVEFLKKDGDFSEFAHKMMFGVPNTVMTRDYIGNPTPQDVANVMKYVNDLGAIVAKDKCGKSTSTYDLTNTLHIPKVSVETANGKIDYWATLRYAPQLSANGSMTFELAELDKNLGECK